MVGLEMRDALYHNGSTAEQNGGASLHGTVELRVASWLPIPVYLSRKSLEKSKLEKWIYYDNSPIVEVICIVIVEVICILSKIFQYLYGV
ncbi:hypothetical protein CMV_003239 [Castanea mollissima]|uniref:Uncharacterized protein n=1 Tax=Castanea mollissima TaxID=60419 RepID=A0A8J4VWU9_9ROSI|nr:hypothetical protein CMV_003239 [Castanea mollissima]